jgi:uncharacterized ion transporter superfamily protein YfcC
MHPNCRDIALQAAGLPISEGVGFLFIILDVIIIPLVLVLNAQRFKRRSEVFSALSLERNAEHELGKSNASQDQTGFLDPSYFKEAWKAGKKSERAVFMAALRWIDVALERPVSHQ